MSKKNETPAAEREQRMPFGRQNYILMAVGLGLIVLGFILMTGGGSDDPDVFDAARLFSFRRITLAPILVLAGLGLEIYAIMKRPKVAGGDSKSDKK